MLFNLDMDQRLADLQSAVTSGGAISAAYHSAFQHLPERVAVDIVGTKRRLVFDVAIAQAVAGQLTSNGQGDAAGVILAAIPAS